MFWLELLIIFTTLFAFTYYLYINCHHAIRPNKRYYPYNNVEYKRICLKQN